MFLTELFDQDVDVKGKLKQASLDFLTPMVASNVPFVTIDQVIDELKNSRPGIVIDRSLIMSVLDPQNIKCVKKIEGDRIYLQQPTFDQRAVSDTQEEKDKEKVHNVAQDQAKKAIKK